MSVVGLHAMLLCPMPGTALLTGFIRGDGRVLPTNQFACRPAASPWRGNEMRLAAAASCTGMGIMNRPYTHKRSVLSRANLL